MKISNIYTTILHTPLATFITSVVIASVVLLITWFGYYAPEIAEKKQQAEIISSKAHAVTRKLNIKNKLKKQLYQNAEYLRTSKILTNNKQLMESLFSIIFSLNNNSHHPLQLSSELKNRIDIKIKPNNMARFYNTVKKIEAMPNVDRIGINKDKQYMVLNIFIKTGWSTL